MQTLIQDIRYAIRLMIKNRGFTIVVVLTLALGIGANAALFNLTDKVLLQSLPVSNPDELLILGTRDSRGKVSEEASFSYPMYKDLRDKNQVLAGVIARGGARMNVSYGDQNDRVDADLVSGNFFQVLGVRPWLGRLFTQDDDQVPGAHPVAVISYDYWRRRFAKDPSIVGKTILANEQPITVIGVTPPEFYGVSLSSGIDVWVPLMMTTVFNPLPPTRLQSRRHQWLLVMARRQSSVSEAQTASSLDVLYQQIREQEANELSAASPKFSRADFLSRKIAVFPGEQGFRSLQREIKTSLLLLLGATCIVLLILCGNIGNLLMARATVRASEMAVRRALGAGRMRLLRQWLTEGIVLSIVGGTLAILVGVWVKSSLLVFLPRDVRTNLDTPIGLRFIGFTLLVAFVVGLLFSITPAIQAARQYSLPAFNLESRSVTSGGRFFSMRNALIVLQVGLSLPLLITAGLLLRTLQNLRGVPTGFEKQKVLFASLNPQLNGYSPEKTHNFYTELLQNARAMPGVIAASLATDSPLSGGFDQLGLVVEGYTPRKDERMSIEYTGVSDDYFKSLDIPLVQGRDFNQQDKVGSQKVAIINEKMAQYFFGNTNPIGKRIGTDNVADLTIVGVVKDAKYVGLREEMRRHFYTPTMQQVEPSDMVLHVRTAGPPDSLAGPLRDEIKRLDPHLAVYNLKSLSTEIDQSLLQERLVTWLSIAFGLLATLLTALGLYGVLTFSVARRTREIGIRVALGAQRRDVFRLVVTQGVALVAIGIIIGLGASVALSRVIGSLLFGVTPTNPMIFVAVPTGLALIAFLACYLPARRATKVDPLVALRYE